MSKKHLRGIAIEYVMLTMALVAGLVSALLISASLTAQAARRVRNYAEQKEYLDDSARIWLDWLRNGGKTADELEKEFNENERGYVFHVGSDDLFATYRREVVLYVEVSRPDGVPIPTAYRYGYIE